MKRLFIFEGPDGVGKTTLAVALAKKLDAHYAHLGPFSTITDGRALADEYYNAMMPATNGARDVVMDRSWISEVPYGIAYRGGVNRLMHRASELENCAKLYTHAVVLRCNAQFRVVLHAFQARNNTEYLDNEDQLRVVWKWYRDAFRTSLEWKDIWPRSSSLKEALTRILA
jgi:thymidylate kinase